MASGRYIKVRRLGMTHYTEGRTQGYRIKIEAYESNEMPLEIFVFQRFPESADMAEYDEFANVASPADIEEYPVDVPIGPERPFYRLADIDLVFRDLDTLESSWLDLLGDIRELVATLDAMDDLVVDADVIIGDYEPSSSSSSSSA